MTLTTRLAVAMITLVAIALGAVGWLSYRSLEQALLLRARDRLETQARQAATDLEYYTAGAKGDVTSFRSAVALQGLIRAHLAGGTDPADGASEKTWRERLAVRLAAELEAKPAYSMLRIIGLDNDQREIVRVDRWGPNGTVRVVPDEELQVRGDRSYFQETIRLRPPEIYVSPLDLGRHNGLIETIHRPTLRVATPVFAADGKPFGIFMINVDMRRAFDRIRSSEVQGEKIYVVNKRGDYLVHPDRSREFGSLLGNPTDWKTDFPYLASSAGTTQSVADIVPDQSARPGGAVLAPAILAGSDWVAVIETIPNAIVMAPAAAIRHSSILVGSIAVLCAAALAILIARSLTRPIIQLTSAVKDIARKGTASIPVDAQGETGVLARAFARVMDEVNAKTVALEREIAEHRHTEAVLQRQAEERRRIFETSQDLLLVLDGRGHLVQISPSCEAILGYKPEEMIGHSGEEFVHPDDLEIAREEMRAARRGRRMKISDTRCIHKDGHIVWLSWLGAWSDPARRFFFVGRDMTESREAEETLRESEQLARGIINTSLDAFVQIDERGSIRDWNAQAEVILGWPRQDALGKNVFDLIGRTDRQGPLRTGLARFVLSGQDQLRVPRHETRVRRRDGKQLTAELSVTSLRIRDGFVFNVFIRDLTDKIAAEDRVRQAEKMEAVGQLTGGIAHDFNNILTVITGTIEILADAVKDQPQLAAITRMIDEAASRGADLTQHLLAFARRQPLEPRETDINQLIIDTTKLLQRTLGEQVEIESAFEDETCPAIVDPNQLATAILNLALNARDAMPGGGKLIIETACVVLDEGYARMHGDVRPGHYAMIAVSDTGSGIPAANLDKVFNPFFTSKGPGKGTGLGLSMVYGFIKQSAGHIKIYSEEGVGTTIRLYLPPASGAALAAETAFEPEVQGGNETILVVEDDKLVRDYVLTQLHSLGYVTLDAENAAQALGIVKAGHAFDLLFTDVIMPGLNGRQLADEMLKIKPGLKVLFTSGYTENAIVHHGRLDEGVLLLAKPYRKSDMAIMIRKALAA
jgi:PAS domain S-box-containing protein